MNLLLSTAYFPNIQYFSKIILKESFFIEVYENFPKQTFRNRCQILGPNGVADLIVPVIKGRGGKTNTKDIKISYAEDWQRIHYQAIKSNYASAPFFDFYFEDIEPFFNKKYEYLIDFNSDILMTISELLSLDIKINYTEDFIPLNDVSFNDLRFALSPKITLPDSTFSPESYIQVFEDRMEFMPNLSILDLIFNLGPESTDYIKKSFVNL